MQEGLKKHDIHRWRLDTNLRPTNLSSYLIIMLLVWNKSWLGVGISKVDNRPDKRRNLLLTNNPGSLGPRISTPSFQSVLFVPHACIIF